jgi:hypothetical protein
MFLYKLKLYKNFLIYYVMISIHKTIVFYGYVYLANNSLNEINKLYLNNLNPPKSLVILNYSILFLSSSFLIYTGREILSDINKNL